MEIPGLGTYINRMNELSASPPDTLTSLIGMDRAELARAVEAIGEPEKGAILRAKQLWHWIYHHGVDDFSHMTSLNGALRDALAASYTLERPKITREQKSQDGTRKWLLRFADGQEAESVFIPEEDLGALSRGAVLGGDREVHASDGVPPKIAVAEVATAVASIPANAVFAAGTQALLAQIA